MKNILVVLTVLLVVVVGYFIYVANSTEEVEVEPEKTVVEQAENRSMGVAKDAVYGYEFSYPDGIEGYITLEDNESTDPDFVTGVTLMNWREYEEFAESTKPREGPASMHMRVYNNPENLHAPVWALRHPLDSNIELAMTEPEEAVVGGANAVHYITDGLYPTDTYVVASGQHIYVLMGAYNSTEDQIYQDFQDLVSSFTFIPNQAPVGKLNVSVVCEGALAYMTFTDGEAAEDFVSDCVNGEHPEVIERYLTEQGLDGAAI